MELSKYFLVIQRKTNNNYDAYVILNLSNGYIHLYWTRPSTFPQMVNVSVDASSSQKIERISSQVCILFG